MPAASRAARISCDGLDMGNSYAEKMLVGRKIYGLGKIISIGANWNFVDMNASRSPRMLGGGFSHGSRPHSCSVHPVYFAAIALHCSADRRASSRSRSILLAKLAGTVEHEKNPMMSVFLLSVSVVFIVLIFVLRSTPFGVPSCEEALEDL